MSKKTDYNLEYKKYYNINFDSSYVVHHMDFNRENNDISNLVLLPRKLHAKYHMILGSLGCSKENALLDLRLSQKVMSTYSEIMLSYLFETISECNKWIKWKNADYSEKMKQIIWGGKDGDQPKGF